VLHGASTGRAMPGYQAGGTKTLSGNAF